MQFYPINGTEEPMRLLRGHLMVTCWWSMLGGSFWKFSSDMFFVLFGVYRPTREFCTHLETSPLQIKGCNFDLCSTLTAIEQWGSFNVPHPLRHGPTVYNGHHNHTCCRAFGSGAVTTCFYDSGLSRPGIKPRSPACKANALPLRNRGGIISL